VLLAAVLAAASLAGVPSATYPGPVVSFSYPATWQAAAWPERTRSYVPLVGVANQALRDPCSVTANLIRCGFPVGHLKRGGVVGWWSRFGLIISPEALVVTNFRVGGRGATIRTWRGGHCRTIGGDRTIVVTVLPGNLRFEACLRAPGLAARERQIRALLASASFLS
jgi:hypothetical protein